MNRRSFIAGASALIAGVRVPFAWAASSRSLLYLGTRAQGKGQGISCCFFDAKSATGTAVTEAAEIVLPTAFAVSANRRYLYATSEVGNDGKSDGSLSAFAIDHRTGALKLLNTVPSGGGGPTFISLDATGKTLAVATFGGGCTNVFRVLPDGKLGEKTGSEVHTGTGPNARQKAPHSHAVVFSPDNRFVISPDLGADRVFISRFDAATGTLTPNDPPFYQMPAGSGPRQIAFHPSGKFAYLMNELSAKVTTFAWNAQGGVFTELQTLDASAPGVTGGGGAILMHRDGKFLFATSRGDNTIVMFAIDQAKGTLSAGKHVPCGGKTPWGIAIDPSGDHLAAMNMDSNAINIFQINRQTGDLNLTGTTLTMPQPVSGIFVPA